MISGVCHECKIAKAWPSGTEMEKFLTDFNSHAYSNMARWKPPESFCQAAHCFSSEGNVSQTFREQRAALHPHGKRESWMCLSHGASASYTYTCTMAATAGIILHWSWSLKLWGSSLVGIAAKLLIKHWTQTVQWFRGRVKECRRNKEQFFNGKVLAAPFVIKPDAIYSVLNCFSIPIDQTYQPLLLLELFTRIILFNCMFNAWPLRRIKRTSSLPLTIFLNETDEDFPHLCALKIT